MPIIDAQDATDVDEQISRIFQAEAEQRAAEIRRLFVEKLDFEPASGAVSLEGARKGAVLPDEAERVARMDSVNVVYVPLNVPDTDRVRNGEAAEAARLVSERLAGDLLLVMTNTSGSQLHVILPKFEGTRPNLRRMIVERDLERRTAVQQLSNIYWRWKESKNIAQALDSAFDVEAVTRRFFEEYGRIFDQVIDKVRGFGRDEGGQEAKKLFVQTMFNRLMFIYFLSRKGWLAFDGDKDYLNALWRDYPARSEEKNFYNDRLKPLFFAGLNNYRSTELTSDPLRVVIGDVPFLNGGLFDQAENDLRNDVVVPNEAVEPILRELFDRFNFTVMESTPFDIEVAVDPEMLGKVFEELVTGRHETGSYYTPRPVVAFMCREALKGYLEAEDTRAPADVIRAFVDSYDTSGLTMSTAPRLAAALEKVTVVDPACGSGAYLLGMMHELVELQTALYSDQLGHEPKDLYGLKLQIIERSLYGVDIDPFAVNIAMLRLWLSLAIDYEGPTPEPLPNLDFKIVCGDSLMGPDPSPENVGEMFRRVAHNKAHTIATLKAKHMRAVGSEKATLKSAIEKTYEDLKTALGGSQAPAGAVDWRVEFAEVVDQNGGFDIAIANPPYVRADAQFKHLATDEEVRLAAISRWKGYRRTLRGSGVYKTLYEKWDLYIPFLERSYQLLRETGEMAFIISDAYNVAKYAHRSHQFFVQATSIKRIDFCSDIPFPSWRG